MATKSKAAGNTKPELAKNKEEEAVLRMYRSLSRWDRNALHLVMNSLAYGRLTEATDSMRWETISKTFAFAR